MSEKITMKELLDVATQQAEKIGKLEKRIGELEKDLSVANELIDNYDFINCLNGEELAKRDLEQQAEGVESFEKLFSFYEPEKDCDIIYAEDAISYCAKLRKQAAKIKEQK